MASLSERFWPKVKEGDGCWEWQAAKDHNGYGRIRQAGAGSRVLGAHQASWVIHFGPIPNGMFVLHQCDNPACVRPTHLYLGDQKRNILDMIRRGRRARVDVTGRKRDAGGRFLSAA